MTQFNSHMDAALEQAHCAATRGEVPVGAVLTDASGAVVAADGNRTRERCDPTAHAEVNVIRAACAAAGRAAARARHRAGVAPALDRAGHRRGPCSADQR